MKSSIVSRVLLAVSLLMPSFAAAGIALAPLMQHWHQARKQIDAMVIGNLPYDAASVRASMRLYAADALIAATHVTGSSAAARDFTARFAQFAKDANSADAASSTLATFRPQAQRLNGECEACHAIYNN